MLVLGTTTFWPIADGMLLWYFYRRREFVFSYFTVGIMAIGFANGGLNLHVLPMIWGIRIALIYSLMRGYRFKSSTAVWYSVGLVLVVQAGWMATQVVTGMTRPYGMSLNALLSADMGFAFLVSPLWPVAAVVIALSGSRTVIFAAILLAGFQTNKHVWLVVGVTVLMWVMFVGDTTPERLQPGQIQLDTEARIETVNNGKHLGDECGPIRTPEYTIDGYGVGLYCEATGRQGPHNVFVMSLYSLGLLAIPFWLLLQHRFGWRWWYLWPALFAISFLTDDLFTRPEGVYVLALLVAHYRMYFGTRDFRLDSVE